MNWTNLKCNQFDHNCITLNWTVSLKCPEMTFAVIWCFINKTEVSRIIIIINIDKLLYY